VHDRLGVLELTPQHLLHLAVVCREAGLVDGVALFHLDHVRRRLPERGELGRDAAEEEDGIGLHGLGKTYVRESERI